MSVSCPVDPVQIAFNVGYSLLGGLVGGAGTILCTQAILHTKAGTALVLQGMVVTALSTAISNLVLHLLKSRGYELNFGIKCASDIGAVIVVLLGASALGVACPVPLIIASMVAPIITRLAFDPPAACQEFGEGSPLFD